MRSHWLAICALLFGAMLSSVAQAQPGSGTRWEISMEMPGMPAGMAFSMPKQTACLSRDENEAPPADDKCTLLEQHSSGNRHFVKMQCPDGLTELDQTRTADSMTSLMKMTDSSGVVTEMTMRGTVTGDCDYTAETAQRERQMAGLQRQAEAAEKRGKEQMTRMCTDALTKMQGTLFTKDGICAAQQDEYCKRANTLDGYRLLAEGVDYVGADKTGAGLDEQLAVCGKRGVDLRRQHCAGAVKQGNFDFVQRFCPTDAPALCSQALGAEKLAFLSAVCPVEKQALVDQHCAGRKYSSQIAEKYRSFCAGTLGSNQGAEAAAATDRTQPDAGNVEGNEAGKEGVTTDVKQGVKEGVKNLKKVFGF